MFGFFKFRVESCFSMYDELLPKLKSSLSRSKSAVENIIESAEAIANEGNSDDLTARKLSEKSGYSIGALYHHLHKVEHAFILMLFRRRDKKLSELVELINQFPEDQPINNLMELLADNVLAEIKRMNRKVLLLIARMTIKFSKDHLQFDNVLSILADPLIAAQKRDTTGTFRAIEREELLMVLRLCAFTLRRPFLEQNSIAGTKRHRDFAVDTMVRLLGNPS